MIGFKILEEVTTQNYRTELTLEDINNVVDTFAERKDIITARMQLKLPATIIKAAYKDIQQVANTVYNLMKGVSVKTFEVLDEEGQVVTPKEYYNVPTTLEELKTSTWELIARDFDQKVASTYDVQDVAELQSKVELLVDKTIAYSKADGAGDWIFFKSKF